jgi:hypothetical protein
MKAKAMSQQEEVTLSREHAGGYEENMEGNMQGTFREHAGGCEGNMEGNVLGTWKGTCRGL